MCSLKRFPHKFTTESLVALTDALHKNRISNFYTWQRPNIKDLLPGKVIISLDSAFSWLFLLVCFDTKPLFLKVKKSKISFYIPVVSKNQNSLVFTFEKIFGSFLNLWRYFFRTSIHFNWLQSQNILQANVKLTWLVKEGLVRIAFFSQFECLHGLGIHTACLNFLLFSSLLKLKDIPIYQTIIHPLFHGFIFTKRKLLFDQQFFLEKG